MGIIISRRKLIIKSSLFTMLNFMPAFSFLNKVGAEILGNSILKNSMKFNGVPIDNVLCLQHLGHGYRAYNTNLYRFHAQDSLSPFSYGGNNSYAYVNGDPINNIDPSGNVGERARAHSFNGTGAYLVGSDSRHIQSLVDLSYASTPGTRRVAQLYEYHPSVTGWGNNIPSRAHSVNDVFGNNDYRFIGYHSTNITSAISIVRNGILASAIGTSGAGQYRGAGFYCAPSSGLADCFRRSPKPTMLRIYIRNDRFINSSGIDGGYMGYEPGDVSFTRWGSLKLQGPGNMETIINKKYYPDIRGSIASSRSSCSTLGPVLARRHSLGG